MGYKHQNAIPKKDTHLELDVHDLPNSSSFQPTMPRGETGLSLFYISTAEEALIKGAILS